MNEDPVSSYCAYGLTIRSALPLPELVPTEAAPDVEVRLGSVDVPAPEESSPAGWVRAAEGATAICWNQVATFLVRGGREILVDPAPEVEEPVLRLYLLGSALGLLLQQRGRLVLHASAVALDTGAVAFLAGPRWGKSSLAAALHARGHPIVADDVTAVQVNGERPITFPGFPQLKPWPDAAAAVGDTVERLPRLHPRREKRGRRVERGFSHTPLPLRQVYVLAEGLAPTIERLPPGPAFLELVRHSYSARLLAGAEVSAHFRQCSRLAGQAPVSRLRRPQDLDILPDLARQVERDNER